MEILVFKTDIKTKKRVKSLKPVFNSYSAIKDWSVDTKDIDHVLRVETSGGINETDILQLVRSSGFYCEILTD